MKRVFGFILEKLIIFLINVVAKSNGCSKKIKNIEELTRHANGQ